MLRLSSIVIVCLALDWFGAPATARAQASQLAGCKFSQTRNMTGTVTGDHYILDGTEDVPIQIDCDDVQFFADHMEMFQKEGRVLAEGNVVYISGANRIYAERMVFNTKTRTGTFYNATGTATLRESVEPNIFGAQEPDAFFWGDELQKIGPKKYRIIRGGFTTCVQPTPRWEMRSGSVTLNLDEYAILKNAVFRVKNVPLMFLPVFYYPIQEDDRATGFLMPIYGSTTTQGQSISNQFFWAIDRSQDATIEHDWFSKTGQRIGGEYRYVRGPGSQGNAQMALLNEHPTTYAQPDGTVVNYDGKRSYSVVGGMAQRLPLNLRARANANYTTSIVSRQRYQQDIFQSTNRSRSFGGNLSGSWSAYSISLTADKNDYFRDATSFQTTGSLPRISFSRGEQAIGGAPLYFGVNSEYVTLARSTSEDDVETRNTGLTRFDLNPTLRIPFNRWQFFTVNSVVSWRGTYWTESLDEGRAQVPVGIGRRYVDFQARITGPVFNRIWNTENNRYAQKFKHVIEPTLTIQRTSAIDNRARIVFHDGTDYVVGGVTRFNYGVSNRLYAKKDSSREIVSATISQSYYTVATAAQFDPGAHSSGLGTAAPTNFGSVVLQVRGSPTDRIQGDFRTEWDPTVHTFKTYAANGGVNVGEWLQTNVGWSQRRYLPDLPHFDNEASATNYLTASTSLRRPGNRIGGAYSFYYDLKGSSFQQQRFTAYYNAQCCGVGIEYQTYNFAGSFASFGVPQDRRFNVSFTLAGVGTFSNLFGAFGGQQGR